MKGSGTRRSHGSDRPSLGVGWIPPFLLGGSAAVAGELAAALLLYSSDGFLTSLTVVLATETGALALGLLFSRGLRPWDLDGLRYRWLLTVLSFGGASVFAGAWGLGGGFSASPTSQGLGLGLLAALPFFATGAVLGALDVSEPGPGLHRKPGVAEGRLLVRGADDGTGIATWASLGAATGFVLTGVYGLGEFLPASLLLFCVVLVSAAALLHGWLVDRSLVVRPLVATGSAPEARTAEGPDRLHVERWTRGRPPLDLLVLRTPGRLADARKIADEGEGDGGGSAARHGGVVLPWERQVLELLRDGGGSALVAGSGTGALSTGLAEGGRWEVEVVEPRSLPDSLGRWRAGPLSSSADWEEQHRGRHDAVIVNLRLLPDPGLLGSRARRAVFSAAACRRPGGLLLLGGVDQPGAKDPDPFPGWLTDLLGSPPSRYRPGAGSWSLEPTGVEEVLSRMGEGGGLLVHGTSMSIADREKDPGGAAADAGGDGTET